MIRLFFGFVFCLVLSLAAVHAQEPPLCKGKDLLAELGQKDPKLQAAVQAEARAFPNHEAMLWRIEPPSGAEPSWLFGTAHLTDPRIVNMPEPAHQALLKARIVALELAEIRDRQEMAMATLKYARLLVLPLGQSLWDLIPDKDEAFIRDNPNLPKGKAATLDPYQPWVVAMMLSIPACEARRQQANLPSLDQHIAMVAASRDIPVTGLETLEEQLSIFAGMPLSQQAQYLVAAAQLGPIAADYFETMVQLYLARRINVMMPLAKRLQPPGSSGDMAVYAFFEEELINKRNKRMAERAKPLIDKGNAFIAVGALHLPGKTGLVELLRSAGYKVSPVN
jgi:uncharacterized protein YbaP (TraB family)